MERMNRLDCRELKFNPELSKKRLKKAHLVIKFDILRKVLCFCLYLLGANRNDIGNFLDIPHNTVRSMLRTILRDGVCAFFDRRGRKTDDSEITPTPVSESKDVVINVNYEDQVIFINNAEISIPPGNKLQFKSIVLTLADNKLISKTEAGSLLGVTSSHVGYLCKNVKEHDINFLIDKRQGQRHDYVYTPELKSELILQFVVNASEGKKTSGQAIVSAIQERKQIVLSDRSVRHHVSRLGLNMIAGKITETVSSQKKTRRSNYECRK